MPEFSDDGLYQDPDLAQFYDLRPGRRADFDYCLAMAAGVESVLDLGCGTGELTVELAAGRSVTGVDPAAAMLDLARRQPGGDRVTWVEADARTVRLDQRFDLVLLTGHAFQVFLTDADQDAALATIAAHLKPGGRFVFDTRNPAFGGRKERNQEETVHSLAHPQLGEIEAWNESRYDKAAMILSYSNSYRVEKTGAVHSASAQIRYTGRDDLSDRLGAAGLAVDTWLGDWQGNPYRATSKEIVPIGRLA
jgi:SAM-dependent methyltransferase